MIAADKTNFAPRIGVVWSPSPKTSVRTGYGIFYAQDSTNPVFDMSRNIQGRITAQSPGLTLAQPYDGGATNPCGVQMPPQVCVTAPQVLGNQYDRRTPYVEQYLLNFQREVGASMAVEVGYFGSRGHRLQRFISLNQPVPGTSLPILARAPAPELGNWQMINGVGHSNYNALATKLTRRLSNGFSGLVSYTYSKSMDNGSGLRSPGEQLKPQQGDCWECENGRSVFDVRHRLTTSFLYELPFGTGRKYLSQGGVLDAVAGGWQLARHAARVVGVPAHRDKRCRSIEYGARLRSSQRSRRGQPGAGQPQPQPPGSTSPRFKCPRSAPLATLGAPRSPGLECLRSISRR